MRPMKKRRRHWNHLIPWKLAQLFVVCALVAQGCGFGRPPAEAVVILNEPYPRHNDPDTVVFNDLPVRLYFHSQLPPANTEILRPIRTRSTIVAAGKTCRDAGIEGLRRLQRIAVKYKADAVINIRATWDGEQLGDDTTFGCRLIGNRYTLIWEGALARIPALPDEGATTHDPAGDDASTALRKLESLYYQGLITKEEFMMRREKILDDI